MTQDQTLTTERLLLVPIGPDNADDFHLVHNDEAVSPWYDNWRPSQQEAATKASEIADSWKLHDVHKWIAYNKENGTVIGRGGLSRTPINDDWRQLYKLLPNQDWVREPHSNKTPFKAHKNWLETGWALRQQFWGQGYASEIGEASLKYAFETLKVKAVVSCTARHNQRSKAVMKRVGLEYQGEVKSPGIAEGEETISKDAPYSVFTKLNTSNLIPA